MTLLARLLLLTVGLGLAACSEAKFNVVNFPANYLHRADVKMQRDIAFGPAPWQKLDIYRPMSLKKRPWPVVVFYYGGNWKEGRRDQYAFVGSTLAQQGYIVVIPDYRKYPEIKFPQFEDDAAASLAWVREHIKEYGGQEGPVHVMGHSAGAQIASLLATNPAYLQKYGKTRKDVIKDFLGLAGPYSFTPDAPDLEQMFGPPSQYPQMQATTFMDGTQPPMLLLWGEQDKEVGRQNIERMLAAGKAHGGCVEVKTYKNIDHAWIVASLSYLRGVANQVLPDMLGFWQGSQCPAPQPAGSIEVEPKHAGKKHHGK